MGQRGRNRPGGSARALSEAYDTALLDLDGVVYAGGEAIPNAVDALAAARDGGMHLAYVTNNALRTPDAVAAHLAGVQEKLRQAELDRARAEERVVHERRRRRLRMGLGLTGLTERVRLLGGTATAGPDGGSWVLTAELPRSGARG